MCDHCGCSNGSEVVLTDLQSGKHLHLSLAAPLRAPMAAAAHDHGHHHHDHHDHGHAHHHDGHGHHHTPTRLVEVEADVLGRNDRLAERNRGWFEGRGVLAVNLMSSPGAGKTTLLERTLGELNGAIAVSVIEGDQETTRDAERIRATGCSVIQINTGVMCHLDAQMIDGALRQLQPTAGSLLFIENVGNLVCPAMFDLGESVRVIVASVTEGDDKPVKYPHMFRSADLVLLNKIDLLPYVQFDADAFREHVRRLNPEAEVRPVSATTGGGLDTWYAWLRQRLPAGADCAASS